MLLLNVTVYVPVLVETADTAPLPRTRAPAELTTAHFAAAACAMLGTTSVATSAARINPARLRPRTPCMYFPPSAPPAKRAGPRQPTAGERRTPVGALK